ncbi:MAG: class I SAM-dependent methyltransferase [Vicinamibacterales bacterium]
MNRAEHWDRVYSTKGDLEVSWFEPEPAISLALLEAAGLQPASCVIDVGGGNSRLVDGLLARGVSCLSVLDVSAAAVERTRARLGSAGAGVHWIVADAAGEWDEPSVDLWHDRAVFHFLTDPEDRARYLSHLMRALKPGGAVVMATFAHDGPERCSGLPVARYSADTLAATLGAGFSLEQALPHTHETPWGARQAFQYACLRRQ